MAPSNTAFSKNIINWYKVNGRKDLPWRKKTTPYRVWISEIMLQQTQVKIAIPYFKKFIKTYPSLKSILHASEDEILALWSGLGFYRRAQNIFKAKEIIKYHYKGKFPSKFEEIRELPGIGRSTAGAIMAIAFKQPYPILDANVKRVISRYLNINIAERKNFDKSMWEKSELLKPDSEIFDFTQGIMDIGATICTAKNINCEICPLENNCLTSLNSIEIIKNKPKKRKVKKEFLDLILAYTDKKILLFKRDENRFWQSLWMPLEVRDENQKVIKIKNAVSVNTYNILHKLTHLDLDIRITMLKFNKVFSVSSNMEYSWINTNEINNFGIPQPIKKILRKL